MLYKEFKGLKLPALSMGCMRLPVTGGAADIDEGAAARMTDYAMEHGVNYFDTAWGYHSGRSETVMGKILAAYPRESFFLATKFPGYDLSNMSKAEEIFEKQLEKCGVDYFDFYLFHNVCELNIDGYLDPRNGIYDYLMKQKENGRIRRLGFSTHGSLEVMKRFLAAYGQGMEFCQIQLNWLDWIFQQGRAKVELLRERGLAVWVMEPMRGGSLVRIAEKGEAKLKALRPQETVSAWALRFLQSIPDVTTVITGASSFQQLQENIRVFETHEPVNAAEFDVLMEIAEEMTQQQTLPCTGCRYCVDHCPQGLDIPWLLELYNEHAFSGGGFIAPMALQSLPPEKQPAACVGCGGCEAVCPQQLKISEAMQDFVQRLK